VTGLRFFMNALCILASLALLRFAHQHPHSQNGDASTADSESCLFATSSVLQVTAVGNFPHQSCVVPTFNLPGPWHAFPALQSYRKTVPPRCGSLVPRGTPSISGIGFIQSAVLRNQ